MSEPNTKLSEIQNLPVPELVDRLAELTADELVALRALEASQKDGGRKTALTAIDEAIAKAAAPAAGSGDAGDTTPAAGDTTEPATTPAVTAAAPAAEAAPEWQAEAYDGPLTIPQATWRRANIKPVRPAPTARTK